jgi:hypothetical protein
MPITGTEQILAASMFTMLQKELGSDLANPQAMVQLQKMCTGLANAIVPHILLAQVAPGQATAGSPAAQITTTPGILM